MFIVWRTVPGETDLLAPETGLVSAYVARQNRAATQRGQRHGDKKLDVLGGDAEKNFAGHKYQRRQHGEAKYRNNDTGNQNDHLEKARLVQCFVHCHPPFIIGILVLLLIHMQRHTTKTIVLKIVSLNRPLRLSAI